MLCSFLLFDFFSPLLSIMRFYFISWVSAYETLLLAVRTGKEEGSKKPSKPRSILHPTIPLWKSFFDFTTVTLHICMLLF